MTGAVTSADDAADARRLLDIYLDDHRAGASGGSALARRLAERWAGEPGYEALEEIAASIERDLEALGDIRAELGCTGGQVKRVIALAGERIGRLKPNGRLRRPSPLSRLEELEALSAGIHAKARLWAALDAAGVRVGRHDLARLADEAQRQLDVVGELHRRAAAPALRHGPADPIG